MFNCHLSLPMTPGVPVIINMKLSGSVSSIFLPLLAFFVLHSIFPVLVLLEVWVFVRTFLQTARDPLCREYYILCISTPFFAS